MAFQKYIPQTFRNKIIVPTITVGYSGIIGINQSATEKYLNPEFKFAEFWYDTENKAVGIKPILSNGYKLRYRDGGGADICALHFLRYYELLPKESKRYDCTWNQEYGMITFNMNKPRRRMK